MASTASGNTHFSRLAASALLVLLTALAGCGDSEGETFEMQVDLPPNYELEVDIDYAADKEHRADENCQFHRNDPAVFRRIQTQGLNPEPTRETFVLPVSRIVNGCELKLRRIGIDIWAKWPEEPLGGSRAFAAVSVIDQLPDDYPGMPESGVREFTAHCGYLFRLIGYRDELIKILYCHAVNDEGNVIPKVNAGIAVQRDQLPGNVVRLKVDLSGKESPYLPRAWLKVPGGWKRCVGDGGRFGFCLEGENTFKKFLMDGRKCTIYPGCTEQEREE